FFFSSRRRHTRFSRDWSSDVCSSDLLREVREVADRITVIRLGQVVGEASPTASNEELASLMVGRAVELTVQKNAPTLGDESLVRSEERRVGKEWSTRGVRCK